MLYLLLIPLPLSFLINKMVITRLPTAKATGPHLREVLWAALGSVRSSRRVPEHVAVLVEGLSAFGRCFQSYSD